MQCSPIACRWASSSLASSSSLHSDVIKTVVCFYPFGSEVSPRLLLFCFWFCSGFLQEMKICSAIINLFHLIPAAPQTLVKPLLEVVMKTERAMLIEVGHRPDL